MEREYIEVAGLDESILDLEAASGVDLETRKIDTDRYS